MSLGIFRPFWDYLNDRPYRMARLRPGAGFKPHIRLAAPLFDGMRWQCAALGYTGLGHTPRQAYDNWQRGFSNRPAA